MHHFSVGWGEAVMSLALPPHRVQEGGGLMEPPSWVFVMLQYFENISPLVENL